MKILSFFWRNLEGPNYYLLLRLTQFSHRMSYLSKEKIHVAMAPPLSDVKHMSRKWEVALLEWLMSNILTYPGFIFCRPISFDPSVQGEFGKVLQDNCAMWCKLFIDDRPCFGMTWCIVPSDFTIRKNLLKQGTNVIRCSKY